MNMLKNLNKILRKIIIIFVLPYLLFKTIIINNYISFYFLSLLLIYIFLLITHKSKKDSLIRVITDKILYSILLLFWIIVSAFPTSMIYLYTESSHFCDYIKNGISIANTNEIIDVSLGDIKKIAGGGIQDGECSAIIFYKDNSEQIKNKLIQLGGKKENNCIEKLKSELPDIKNPYLYSNLSNDCIFLKIGKINNGEVEAFLYDLNTDNLFYEYINR